jgi:hypothetical protein
MFVRFATRFCFVLVWGGGFSELASEFARKSRPKRCGPVLKKVPNKIAPMSENSKVGSKKAMADE